MRPKSYAEHQWCVLVLSCQPAPEPVLLLLNGALERMRPGADGSPDSCPEGRLLGAPPGAGLEPEPERCSRGLLSKDDSVSELRAPTPPGVGGRKSCSC